jgi:hypothetical protein
MTSNYLILSIIFVRKKMYKSYKIDKDNALILKIKFSLWMIVQLKLKW